MTRPPSGLKSFTPDAGAFECGGVRYYIYDTLSFDRYEKLREFTLEMGYSATFSDVFTNLRRAWEYLNATKLGEAAVVIHNVMNGVGKLDRKTDPALRICALFINAEGEDMALYDEAVQQAKIDAWRKEYEVGSFFALAASLVPGWLQAYETVSGDSSRQGAGTR